MIAIKPYNFRKYPAFRHPLLLFALPMFIRYCLKVRT
ncbi:hypothetical protein HNQ81_001548 [Desulfoprunum benzoelyticum]|uniref:Uncharacterized protein n=1 Tax=Desulfoprunum benzoelyticum TaxID=1506996 RepID=A0A840V269_9BACT|nr:hypothetical protein [Desulfoprunum benzoelyticum]